jgi:hypothetical protein
MPDPRKVIGAYIKTKAILVSNEAECARRYGNRKKTFMVKGVVEEVLVSHGILGKRSIAFSR